MGAQRLVSTAVAPGASAAPGDMYPSSQVDSSGRSQTHLCRLCRLAYPAEALPYRVTWNMLHETMARIRERLPGARLRGLSFAMRPDILDPLAASGTAEARKRVVDGGGETSCASGAADVVDAAMMGDVCDSDVDANDSVAAATPMLSRKYQV